MKYYIAEGTFTRKPPQGPEFKELLQGHLAFCGKLLAEGRALFSGPKAIGGGGFIVVKAESQEEAEGYFANDPFQSSGLSVYKVTEFRFAEGQEIVKEWFK